MSARPTDPRDPEAGMTLIEMVVTLTITGVVMAIATAGLLPMYRLTGDVDAHGAAQSSLSVTMMHLDDQIRYAVTIAVATDGRSASYLVAEPGVGRRCHALRWSGISGTGVLQQRGWAVGAAPGAVWSTLATDLRIDRAGFTRPLTVTAPTDDVAYQRLQVKLVASAEGTTAERAADVTFTALNTDLTVANPC